ncbi:MAG: hypothetical protein ACOYZ8_12655 [Chloroflexota bacterium]
MNIRYVSLRLIRRFLPDGLARFLLLRGIVIRPGLETSDPAAAVQRYADVLSARGLSLRGKRVLVFGYGGRFDIGTGLLGAGAAHVVLCDKYAPPDEAHNLGLYSAAPQYFYLENGRVRPRPELMTLFQADIRDVHPHSDLEPVDLVVSSSVYEHLDDVEGITGALAALTRPSGLHVHFVDLRDHYFKYPFEMLRFSETVWKNWLNPSTNHNRYRLWNYRRAFEACFGRVEIQILSREEEAFRRLLPKIRPEFVSGNMEEDAATLILVAAREPKRVA